ncbi:MAG: hypothetical protein ACD_13C00093G0001 [uncultured bacterium]|nr:MAG: hypothetical protein ACD_13C00093G0001 [uncultured bacterium]
MTSTDTTLLLPAACPGEIPLRAVLVDRVGLLPIPTPVAVETLLGMRILATLLIFLRHFSAEATHLQEEGSQNPGTQYQFLSWMR